MKLFVSYTLRDGMVTIPMLLAFHEHLKGVCVPFVHCLTNNGTKWQQMLVLRALVSSHALLLIESPAVKSSRWVQLEIWIARLLLRPIIRLPVTDLLLERPKTLCMSQPTEPFTQPS